MYGRRERAGIGNGRKQGLRKHDGGEKERFEDGPDIRGNLARLRVCNIDLKRVNGTKLSEHIPMSSSFSILASALCAQWFSTLPVTCSRRVAIIPSVFHPSKGEDSVSRGRTLAVMLASDGTAVKRGDPITTLSAVDKVDWLHGPPYGNECCIGPTGVVNESFPSVDMLHDEGSDARNEPEANVDSIVAIRWEERTYNLDSATTRTHA
jgi:hypothetical protein